MKYKIRYHKRADKELSKLPPKLQLTILEEIEKLADNPRPHGYRKMSDYQSERVPGRTCYRVRIRKDYRLIYTIEEEIITVTIVKVRHRSEVYL